MKRLLDNVELLFVEFVAFPREVDFDLNYPVELPKEPWTWARANVSSEVLWELLAG